MKKLILGVGLVLTVSIIHLFNACSADEAEEAYMEQTSKKELLLAKSKEFAKKYGVDMEIRKDILDELVLEKSIADMERDYQKMARYRLKPLTFKLDIAPKKRSNKIQFRSTTTVTEIEELRDTIYEGSATKDDVRIELSSPDGSYHLSGSIYVEWKYGNQVASFVRYSSNFTVSGTSSEFPSPSGNMIASFSTSPFRFDAHDRCSVIFEEYLYYFQFAATHNGNDVTISIS